MSPQPKLLIIIWVFYITMSCYLVLMDLGHKCLTIMWYIYVITDYKGRTIVSALTTHIGESSVPRGWPQHKFSFITVFIFLHCMLLFSLSSHHSSASHTVALCPPISLWVTFLHPLPLPYSNTLLSFYSLVFCHFTPWYSFYVTKPSQSSCVWSYQSFHMNSTPMSHLRKWLSCR